MLLKDALTRWVAPSVTGEVTLELRRGDDYTILDTTGDAVTYDPERLSMERSATAFSCRRPDRAARGADQRHRGLSEHARAVPPPAHLSDSAALELGSAE